MKHERIFTEKEVRYLLIDYNLSSIWNVKKFLESKSKWLEELPNRLIFTPEELKELLIEFHDDRRKYHSVTDFMKSKGMI